MRQLLKRSLAAACVVVAAPASASLAPQFVLLDDPAAPPAAYDLFAQTSTDWSVAAMVVNLTAGSIFQAQAPFGFDNPSTPFSEFDTYLRGNIAGAAGDVGGSAFAFDTQRIDATWYNSSAGDFGTVPLGRLTLSPDAAGTLALGLWARDQDPVTVTASIVSGVITLDPAPDPLLLSGGGVASGGSDELVGDDRLGSTEGDGIESRRELLDAFAELRRIAQELAVPRQPAFNIPDEPRPAVAVPSSSSAAALPEPATVILVGLGLTGVCLGRRPPR